MTLETRPITVSVILSTYNRAHYLSQSLDSILGQSRPPDDIIVVDDGSTDDTADVAARYAGQIRYFHQQNQGKPTALNFAIGHATGSHVCFFDDDDVMLPEALEAHVAFLSAQPDIDYSYSSNYIFDDTGETAIWDRARWRASWLAECPPEELFVRTMEWNGASLAGMLIDIECLKAVGCFRAHLLRAQDYDVMLRLAQRFRGASMGQATYVRRNHSGARGPAHERLDAADRYRASHKYEQLIFRELRNDLALAEYLPKNDDFSPVAELSDEQQTEALLTRSQIMFNRGLFAEGVEDISLLLKKKLNPYQHQRLIALAARATNIQALDFLPKAVPLARALAKSARGPAAKGLLDAALKGFYWALTREYQKKSWACAFLLTRALMILAVHRLKLFRVAEAS
jgi:glycosyltransferase involved in cell wall biosynthesis